MQVDAMNDSCEVVVPIVNDIIELGSNQAEITVDKKQILSHLHKLDKPRLIQLYHQLIAEKNDAEKWNYLLNKNTYKYFARKKSSQALIKDQPEDVVRLENNYKEKILEFGEIISKHERMRVDLLTRLNDLKSNRDKLVKVQEETISEFENLVRETGKSLKSLQSGQKLTPDELENIICQMRATRKNMSEVRLNFIKTLDRHTQMEVKTNELQDLGNGLRMSDFSQLREERQCLEEKIEERNNTLEKLRLRCFSDTQILSHVREKKCMLERIEDDEYQELKDVIHEMEITRNFMNDCNAKCERLRKMHAESSTNCGLLDKPELLRDYDDTEFELQTTQDNIRRIRSEIDDINRKIRSANKILSNSKNGSNGSSDAVKGALKKTNEKNDLTSKCATKLSNCILQSKLTIKLH